VHGDSTRKQWKDPPFSMGKPTISMGYSINSYVKLPEGNYLDPVASGNQTLIKHGVLDNPPMILPPKTCWRIFHRSWRTSHRECSPYSKCLNSRHSFCLRMVTWWQTCQIPFGKHTKNYMENHHAIHG
jgi:hypothetical protein